MKRLNPRLILLAVCAVALLFNSPANAQYARLPEPEPIPAFDMGDIHVEPVRGQVYLIAGAGGNITVSIGRNDGVLLVDAGSAAMADKTIAAIKELQTRLKVTKPIRYILNTTLDPEHIGGNEKVSIAGNTISGGNVGGYAPDGAAILAHLNILDRMSDVAPGQKPPANEALPTETYNLEIMKLSEYFNAEPVQLIHLPAASTDGDSMAWFRYSDVIATGDVFTTTMYPRIDVDKGGTIQGTLDALNAILDLSFPEFRTQGGTIIIPGHGRLCDTADVGYYKDMVTIIKDRVQDLMKKGMTLEQVKAARPTRDYDPRYGTSTGPWTTNMFVEAIYKTLNSKK